MLNLQLTICKKSSFTTWKEGHSGFDGYSPLKFIFMSTISNLPLKITSGYLSPNSDICGVL